MPIRLDFSVRPLSDEEFHRLDHAVMGIVFSVHNQMGRLCDERIYQNEIARRCREHGFASVRTEVPVHVSHNGFAKTYHMDMWVDNAVMYELKTTSGVTGEHRAQALNYLLLSGGHRGKLVNMRPALVQHEFVSTRLTAEKRSVVTFEDAGWEALDADSAWLKETLTSAIMDWGAFLDTQLYRDAVIHLRGGEDKVARRIPLKSGAHPLGTQRMQLLSQRVAFKISSVTKNRDSYEQQLRRLILLTDLQALHWINFDRHRIQFKTIEGASGGG